MGKRIMVCLKCGSDNITISRTQDIYTFLDGNTIIPTILPMGNIKNTLRCEECGHTQRVDIGYGESGFEVYDYEE